jgi:DNA (cytosine-5)-methyltransferase 1
MSLIRRSPPASKKNKGKQICEHELAGSDKKKDMPSENTLQLLIFLLAVEVYLKDSS